MDREKLLHYVAPCSLLCYTCPGLKDGVVAECASKLCRYFEGYYDFNDANLPEKFRGMLDEFKVFHNRLERYSRRHCPGCRNNPGANTGCIPGCVVPECVKAHGVDFCGDCPEFPCQKAREFFDTVNPVIGADWENGGQRIRDVGIDAYFEEKKDVSHYISYKKPTDGENA